MVGEGAVPRAREGRGGKLEERVELASITQGQQLDGVSTELLQMFSELGMHELKVRMSAVLVEAKETMDGWFGVEAAQKFGASFEWPAEVTARDTKRLEEASGDLSLAVQRVRAAGSAQRLNEKRVRSCVGIDDPDFGRVLDIAMHGLRVGVGEGFVPTSTPQPFRQLYQRVQGAVNGAILGLWEKELVLLIPTAVAERIHGIHYSPAHWAKKYKSEAGRYIADDSDSSAGSALNTPEATEFIEGWYGKIVHPTIQELVQMVNRATKKYGGEDVMLWKRDLKGAFTLVDFAVGDVAKLACPLTGGITMVYHTGYFGWTGTPFGFDVVTRVLRRGIRARIRGMIDMYVDDLLGASHRDDVQHDTGVAENYCEALLGPEAIAPHKREEGRRLDWIGYTVDLDLAIVTIKRSNFLKTLHGFVSTDVRKKQSVKHMQRLASWATRYSGILRHMRPFSSGLYAEVAGMKNQEVTKIMRWEGARAVVMWTAMLILLEFDEGKFARTLESFEDRDVDTIIRFDASLTGVGVTVNVLEDGTERLVGVIGTIELPFKLSDSSYQNTMEFVAVVMGCFVLADAGYKSRRIGLVGDSMTALHWAVSESFSGSLVFAPALLYVLLGGKHDLWVCQTTHVAGVDNVLHDQLSRGTPPCELGFDEGEIVDVSQGTLGWKVLELCDPGVRVSDLTSLTTFWKSAVALVSQLRKRTRE